MHVHVCSFFQATSHDQLGDPCGGYTCYPTENTTYDVNQSAMDWRSRQAFQKTGMLAPRLLFCRYQGFVEQHQDPDPQVEDGSIMGSAFLHGVEDRQKNRCVLLVTFLQVTKRQLMHIYGVEAAEEAAEQPAAAGAPNEAKAQAPKGAAEQLAAAAAPNEAKPHAPVGGPKEAKPHAPVGGAEEAKPQATKEGKEKARQQPAEQWLRPGVTIPGWDAESDDSSSGGHFATFFAGEIGELTDVELKG